KFPVVIENIDVPIAGTGNVVVLVGILLGIRHKELTADILNAERGKSGRDVRIGETAGECSRGEILIEDVDGAGMEIGRKKEVSVRITAQGEPLVDGTVVWGRYRGIVNLKYGDLAIHARIPGGDRAVLGGENEDARPRVAV